MINIEINWLGEIFDTLISLTGKYARWLNIKGKKLCFIIWSACCVYWTMRDIYLQIYSQAIFCLVSLGFHVYGYMEWKKKGLK